MRLLGPALSGQGHVSRFEPTGSLGLLASVVHPELGGLIAGIVGIRDTATVPLVPPGHFRKWGQSFRFCVFFLPWSSVISEIATKNRLKLPCSDSGGDLQNTLFKNEINGLLQMCVIVINFLDQSIYLLLLGILVQFNILFIFDVSRAYGATSSLKIENIKYIKNYFKCDFKYIFYQNFWWCTSRTTATN